MTDPLGAGILMLLFASIIGIAEVLMRRGKLAAETARKTIHFGGGLGCLLFPFLVTSWITVLVLAIAFSAVFYLGEKRNLLRSLSSVERTSCGSMIFPFAVLLLFVLSDGRLWLYTSALLVLVMADTAAAMAGVRWGRIFYETAPGEKKSLEGTVAFCLMGFFAVLIPLLVLSGFSTSRCILISILMAFLLAGLEAVSVAGTDNLFVPLGTVYILLKSPFKSDAEVLFQCISLLVISIILFLENRKHATLKTRPLILFLLFAYSAWSLGSAEWMVPVFAGFILYNRVCRNCAPLPNLGARELLRPLYPSIIILFLANTVRGFNFWFMPFVVATSIATALCVVHRYRIETSPSKPAPPLLLASVSITIVLSMLLGLPLQFSSTMNALIVAIPLSAGAVVLYNRWVPLVLSPFMWNYAIPLQAGLVAGIYVAVQLIGLVPLIEPSTWAEVFR